MYVRIASTHAHTRLEAALGRIAYDCWPHLPGKARYGELTDAEWATVAELPGLRPTEEPRRQKENTPCQP